MKNLFLASAVLSLAVLAQAGDKHDMPAAKPASKEFEMIKGLVGDWEGSADMGGGKAEPTTTSFRLTSAGSAVVETMGAGTPHEMTNVYHDVDGKLMMTHYCAIGNAPVMKVVKSDDKSIALETVAANGISPKSTPHMHGLVYSWKDPSHITGTWRSANMGHDHQASSVFEYARVPRSKSR